MSNLIPIEQLQAVVDPLKLRVMVMGAPKIGKSSFCTRNLRSITMDTDNNGCQFLKCFRVPCPDWMTMKKTLGELMLDENKGRFDTVILDTVDLAWQRCREFVCARERVNHESEDKSFGRIWDMVKTEFNKLITLIQAQGWGLWMTTHTVQKEVKAGGIKRTVTSTILPASAARVLMALADIIVYLDVGEDGKRILVVKPEDTLEVGDRTGKLTENITFSTPEEGYSLFMGKFKTEKE